MNGFVEFLGWFGAVTVLLGYLLFSTGKLPNGPVYQLFNLVGGLSVAVNVAAHHAVPSTIVNGIWALVAMVVLVRMSHARRAVRRGATLPTHHAANVEPPTTTAVLPVIGPALRDHDDAATAADHPPTAMTTATATDDHAGSAPVTATATAPATATATAPATTTPTTGSIPLVESVPVITAALALALVHAAQDHTAAAQATGPSADGHPESRDHTDEGSAPDGEHHPATSDAEHRTSAT